MLCYAQRERAYRVHDAAYPAVFAFPKKGSCAATLIDDRHAQRRPLLGDAQL
jgi:hypothetical protein